METATDIDSLLQRDLDAARTGDQNAYGRVVARVQNTVTSVALAIVRDVEASEDVAQDALLQGWQQIGQLRSSRSFLPWLRQITRNRARDHLRATRRRPGSVEQADEVLARMADPAPCPAGQRVRDEEQAIVAEVLDQLPEDSREVLLLYYREGQSSRQVADLLGLQDAAVRQRLSRARSAVRTQLLERLSGLARETAPGVAFTGAVLGALGIASPPTAAAAVLGMGSLAGSKTLWQVLLGSAGAIAIGLGAAFVGIFWGLRCSLRGALDDVEKRGLTRSALIVAATTVAFLLSIVMISAWTAGWLPPLLATLVFFLVVTWQTGVVQPRLMARRHEAQHHADPVRAAAKRRRERLHAWLGYTIGLVFGLGGLIVGLYLSGRFDTVI